VGRKSIHFFGTFPYDAIVMRDRVKPPAWNSTADVVGSLVSQLPQAGRIHEYRVWSVWDEVVGEALARKVRPAKIQHGKLFVTVPNAVLIQELQFSKVQIKARLNQRLGGPVVKDIFFVAGDRRGTEPQSPMPASPRPLPPFTELSVPTIGSPEVERAFTAVLTARRRRLADEGRKRSRG
jgi:hypothetical protein